MRNYAAAQPNGEPVEPVEPDEGASLQEEDTARQRSNVANNLLLVKIGQDVNSDSGRGRNSNKPSSAVEMMKYMTLLQI